MSDSAFDGLLRTQPSPTARERLHNARRELALNDNDALWGLLQVVQDYCASLGPQTSNAPSAPPPVRWVFQPWQLVSAGLAMQTLVIALAFLVGCNWSHALPSDRPWLCALLSVPAGWMMFVLALPVLGQGVLSSWHARKRDGLVGWILLSSFLCAIASCALALCWLLL